MSKYTLQALVTNTTIRIIHFQTLLCRRHRKTPSTQFLDSTSTFDSYQCPLSTIANIDYQNVLIPHGLMSVSLALASPTLEILYMFFNTSLL